VGIDFRTGVRKALFAYRRGSYPPIIPAQVLADPAARAELMKIVTGLDRDRKISDAAAFIEFLSSRPEVDRNRFGATGYCMGGNVALTAAGAFPERFAAVASFHGGNLATDQPDSPHLFVKDIRGHRQAARDWESFLTLRAAELRAGGRLVVALPALDHDGTVGFASMMNHANAELFELVAAGAIAAEERGRMTIAACPRREQDLLAPFASDRRFHGLAVEHSDTLRVPDPAWIEFQRDGDAAAFASKRAGFFRAVFVPSLSQALAPTRDAGEREVFADRLQEGIARRFASNPASLENMVGIIALHKQAAD
jgi:hypothetical protein